MMKRKSLSILVAALLGAQSMFACEFCGQKEAAHGYALQIATTLAYILRGFADTYGTNALEEYYAQEQSPELNNASSNDDSDEEEKDEDLEVNNVAPQIQIVHVIPENHFNQEDTNFRRDVAIAADRNELIWAAEGIHYREDAYGTPLQTEGMAAFGTEDAFANTLATFVAARSIFNLDAQELSQPETQTYLLGELIDIINAIITAENESFIAAINNHPALQGNKVLNWIKRNRQILLGMNFQKRTQKLQAVLRGKKGLVWKEDWKALLGQGMAVLFKHCATLLPQNLQIPQQYLTHLTNPATIDIEQITPILGYWRDLFIAKNLIRLSDYATVRGLPLVLIVGEAHVDHINQLLGQVERIQTTSNIEDLPLNQEAKESKKARMKEGNFDK